jgi:hypothetical protein
MEQANVKDIYSPIQTACLATACFCSLVAFAAMADATDFARISAFQFTVAAGVLVWSYTLCVLLIPAVTVPSKQLFGHDLETMIKIGNRSAFLTAYTGK